MENLYSEIENTIILPKEAYLLIEENCSINTYSKGEPFLKAGSRNTILGFLQKGLFRSYYIDIEGKEITTAFIEEGTFFTDLNSFSNKSISKRTIEAIENSQVFFFTEKQQEILREKIESWKEFEKLYYGKILKRKVNFQRELTQSNVTEGYRLFSEEYKQAVKYAPRKQIASFLGISPYTLSRIKL